MAITAAQQVALDKVVNATVYFLELHFRAVTERVCSSNVTYSWGGHNWLGFGTVGGIGDIQESMGVEARELRFQLNIAEPAQLARAAGPVEEYRNREANLYFCPVDDSFALIDTPELCWRGTMSSVIISIPEKSGSDDVKGVIDLRCETSDYGLKRRAQLRMNEHQQRLRHPTDTGFRHLKDLLAHPQLWLSNKVQRAIQNSRQT